MPEDAKEEGHGKSTIKNAPGDSGLPPYDAVSSHSLDNNEPHRSPQPSAPAESEPLTLPPPPVNPALLAVVPSCHSSDSCRAASSLPTPAPTPTPTPSPLLFSQPAQIPSARRGVSLVPLQYAGRKERRIYFVPASNIAAVLRSREVVLTSVASDNSCNLYVPTGFTITQMADRWLHNFVILPLAHGQGSMLVNPAAVLEVTAVKVAGRMVTSVALAAQRGGPTDVQVQHYMIDLLVAVVVHLLDPEGFPNMALHLEGQDLGYGNQILSGYSA
ncbi:hypothetical protein HDU86_000625 [Geranomyces michiganensis]|nr:hypothetical protein HDU86_000625 [Geranomyces michiganensis]